MFRGGPGGASAPAWKRALGDDETVESLAALYHISSENLALRRQFIGLDAEVLALLKQLQPWADEVADAVAEELTDHHVKFSATIDSSQNMHEVFGQVRENIDQTTHAMTSIAAASTEVAQG